MKTAVVILNWNGKDFLKRFLPGLVASVREGRGTSSANEVIIADNASTDGSLEWIAENYPELRIIRLDCNYGYTGGYNKALAQIDAQYYLLINSDIEVSDGWLAPLEEYIDTHPLCGACAPKLHSWQNRDMFEYAGAAGGYMDRYGYPFCRGRVLDWTEKDFGQYDEPADVLWASGACLMVRAELFHRLGGFDERFFAHQEEIDLCWRIQLEGYHVTIIPESTVYHIGGGTLPKGSPKKLELNYRNNLLMLSNNLAKTYALEYYNENYIEPEGAVMEGDESEAEEIASEAAKLGCRKAGKTIFRRMVLDGCSAFIYLVTFKFSYFMAVVRAHREYRKLAGHVTAETIREYLLEKGKVAGVEGIYKDWIVPQALIHRKDIFKRLRSRLLPCAGSGPRYHMPFIQ